MGVDTHLAAVAMAGAVADPQEVVATPIAAVATGVDGDRVMKSDGGIDSWNCSQYRSTRIANAHGSVSCQLDSIKK